MREHLQSIFLKRCVVVVRGNDVEGRPARREVVGGKQGEMEGFRGTKFPPIAKIHIV